MQKTNQVAVITGGSSGMGLATATKLAREGCQTIYLLARTEEKLNQAVTELKHHFPSLTVSALVVDVSNFEQVKVAFAKIAQEASRIDYLFLAAGASLSEKLSESTDSEAFVQDIQINLLGTYNCILCAQPLLGQGSSVVTVASIRGQLPSPSGMGYAAAKGGIFALTRSTALQLAPHGIRVNCISPGAVFPTGMSQHWDESKRARIANETPLQTITTPEEIANVVWFLLSNQSSCLTGQTINCNGGDYMN